MKERITLIDGNSFLFRAFYGIRNILTRKDGTPINAVYGLCSMLINLMSKAEPNEEFYMVFDAEKKNFRHTIFPEYKANRKETPPELIPQFPLSRIAVKAFNIPILEMEGYEADDIIATLTKNSCFINKDVRIVTSDKDLMQLISGCCYLYDSMKDKDIHEKECFEKFGVYPDKLIYFQALTGDSVDNIPGAKGIGPKTAAELISKYGDIDNLYNNTNEITPESRKQKLIDSESNVRMSLELVKLKTDISIGELPKIEKIDVKKLTTFFEKELNSKHLSDIAIRAFGDAPIIEKSAKSELIISEPKFNELINKIKNSNQVFLKSFSENKNFMSDKLLGLALAINDYETYYIPLNEEIIQNDLFNQNSRVGLAIKQIKEPIFEILKNENIKKISYNFKSDFHLFSNSGLDINQIKNYEDIMLISYCINGVSKNSLEELSEKYLSKTMTKLADLFDKKSEVNFANLPNETALNYCAERTNYIAKIYKIINSELQNQPNFEKLYRTYDLPLIPVLTSMEINGVLIDKNAMFNLSNTLHNKINELEKMIYTIAGETFNIASPAQIGKILFEKLGIEYTSKKTKSGNYQTDISTLEELKDYHEIIPYIIEWRSLSKLVSTYTDALPNLIDKKTGRIHSTYLQTSTNTGRLSSRDPNLQNIPIRGEYGEDIRKTFIAENGNKLIIADYSQIQLRLLADLANIESMKKIFNENKDIHLITASHIFNKPENEVSPAERRIAKTTNFSIIYGVSAFGLAEQLGIDRPTAAKIIEKYFQIYPEIKNYMEETKEFVLSHGYILTPWGRKIDLPEITNPRLKQYALRAAINAPIQGYEADLMRLAIIKVYDNLKQFQNAKLIMQIHDELVFEVPENIAEICAKIIDETMDNITKLSIPLIANTAISDKWDK